MAATVGQAIEFLKKFPSNAFIRVYEGEISGIIIENTQKCLGVIYNNGEMTDERNNKKEKK